MKMRRLTAIKPHRYGTRMLQAGDEYEAPAKIATALVVTRKAQFARETVVDAVTMADPPPMAAAEDEPDRRTRLEALQAEADQLGLDYDGRWGVHRLEYEIGRMRKDRQ